MPRKLGRPLKYKAFIETLNRDELYTPATIVDHGVKKGLLRRGDAQFATEHRRVRVALSQLSQSHAFPGEGDGSVYKKGQRPTPGWFGWRWQSILGVRR